MTIKEFEEKLKEIKNQKSENQNLELKSAHNGCPKRLFDTLSSFSNQDDGGIIIFGIDETHDYNECGVYDPQDIQKQINAQCLQMEPVVRPLLTVLEKDEKYFVAAEIPGIDIAERPCFYRGQGRLKGAFVRVGDSDEPMTEYEVYSYEAFRKKYQDDIREVSRATQATLNEAKLNAYIDKLKKGKPNLSQLEDPDVCELMSITRNHVPTLATVLLFGLFPQAYFPQLCITAVTVPGNEVGDTGELGERFLDNERIEGSIPEMLEAALQFVKRNMRTKTIIDPKTGSREDRTDYPLTAVREIILNALAHRDYSIHTEGMPIQILIYEDRLEVRNPGGIYGRITIDQLGKVQPDTRNPVLTSAMEVLEITENRYSGIPTIRNEMARYGLSEPVFLNERGQFIVKLYKAAVKSEKQAADAGSPDQLIAFCQIPRSKQEIAEFLGLSSVTYAIQKYVTPLVEQGLLKMSIPDKPKSRKQKYISEKSL